MNRELINKQDYQILGIKENSTSGEINSAYEKLCLEYHPEKIKLEKLREPTEFEIKKYKEIEKVYKKFDLEYKKYICWGWKGDEHCWNQFYPCLWEKVEDGYRKLFCSQECYNSKSGYPQEKTKEAEWNRQKLEKSKKILEEAKISKINYIKEELERNKVKPEELEPNNRNFEQEINSIVVQNADALDDLNKLYDISDRIIKDIYSKKKEEKEYCDNCSKEIKKYKDENGHIVSGVGSVDNEGNRHKFCSRECSRKFVGGKTTVRKNAFVELLKWMKKEGITNLSLDPNSGKLVVEYGKNNSKTIEDNNLTPEQKEIKEFFQQNAAGNQSLSQNELETQIAALEGSKPKDKSWVMPLTIIGLGAIILTLVGVIIYKSRKKGY